MGNLDITDLAYQNQQYQLIGKFNFNLEAKSQLDPSFLSSDNALKRILQSDWLRAFSCITLGPAFCLLTGLRWNINNTMSFQFRLFLWEANVKMLQNMHTQKQFQGCFGRILPIFGETFWGIFLKNWDVIFIDSSDPNFKQKSRKN